MMERLLAVELRLRWVEKTENREPKVGSRFITIQERHYSPL